MSNLLQGKMRKRETEIHCSWDSGIDWEKLRWLGVWNRYDCFKLSKREVKVWIPGPDSTGSNPGSSTSCVVSGQSLKLSGPPFPHLRSEANEDQRRRHMWSTSHEASPAPSSTVKCWSRYLNSPSDFFKIPPSLYVKRIAWMSTCKLL